ncbi:hypothetical protein OH77DRAFT_1233031 [Trametes cingulata]|nr:hypothetical protein OH77DRAFT_1233031 [Trametes cingulata]
MHAPQPASNHSAASAARARCGQSTENPHVRPRERIPEAVSADWPGTVCPCIRRARAARGQSAPAAAGGIYVRIDVDRLRRNVAPVPARARELLQGRPQRGSLPDLTQSRPAFPC